MGGEAEGRTMKTNRNAPIDRMRGWHHPAGPDTFERTSPLLQRVPTQRPTRAERMMDVVGPWLVLLGLLGIVVAASAWAAYMIPIEVAQ